jgi:glycosyltransferase involved in cell wall biosynthesis
LTSTAVHICRDAGAARSCDGQLAVVLSHPSVAPFVQQAARAFSERGLLRRFITTVRDRPDSAWQGLACRTARWLGFDLARQLRRRAVTEVPTELVLSHPWREMARLATGKVDRSGVWTDRVWEWAETGFDRWAARHALGGGNVVYGYEHAIRACFEAGKDRGYQCVYDVQAPEHDFTQQILDRELKQFPELRGAYQEHIHKPEIHQRRVARRRREWQLADLVIAASTFTRESFAGYEDPQNPRRGLEKVRVIPYGAPPVDPAGQSGGSRGQGPVRFLWAGTLSIRKGAHYLLQAWRRLSLRESAATLDVYGAANLPPALVSQLPASIRLRGGIPREELYDAYRQADALVFPTLCDGFGMVVTEAFSRGLPVLTTRHAGAADLVLPERNGLLVPAASSERLAAALEWCLANRARLSAMRGEAVAAAAAWQWSDYRAALTAAVLERVADGPSAEKRNHAP